jgi:hypothetical protein
MISAQKCLKNLIFSNNEPQQTHNRGQQLLLQCRKSRNSMEGDLEIRPQLMRNKILSELGHQMISMLQSKICHTMEKIMELLNFKDKGLSEYLNPKVENERNQTYWKRLLVLSIRRKTTKMFNSIQTLPHPLQKKMLDPDQTQH